MLTSAPAQIFIFIHIPDEYAAGKQVFGFGYS
jgi:hypothetical protein